MKPVFKYITDKEGKIIKVIFIYNDAEVDISGSVLERGIEAQYDGVIILGTLIVPILMEKE